jgi:Tfp pilus assembly protein PilW
MSQATTLILLPQTAYNPGGPGVLPNTTVTGNAYPAASYYVSAQELQTITWSVTTFRGTVTIQTSLVDMPSTDNDWITVVNLVYSDSIGTTTTSFTNVIGNYVWVRARINNFTQGILNHIKVSY